MNNDGNGADERMGDGRAQAESTGPAYEQDDGPLSEGKLTTLRQIAATRLPNGELVALRSLI